MEKRVLHGEAKEKFYFIDRLLDHFRRDFAPANGQILASNSSLYILHAAIFSYLIRWVMVTYILVNIMTCLCGCSTRRRSGEGCRSLLPAHHYSQPNNSTVPDHSYQTSAAPTILQNNTETGALVAKFAC